MSDLLFSAPSPYSEQARPTSIASKNTTQVIAGANPNRKQISIVNDSTAILYILYGPVSAGNLPSSTNYSFQLPANTNGAATLIENTYTGPICCLWASANGFAYVTEVGGS